MLKKLTQKKWFYSATIIGLSFAGIMYATYLGFYMHNAIKQNLLMRVSTIAQFIAAEDIRALSGSERDLENPAYLHIKDRLMALRAVNPDTRFIYLNGAKNGKVFFYADSENPQSADYSPPGQQYEEASHLVRELFVTKKEGFEVAGDRWGVWASAMVPIIDPASGDVVALLGIDVSARDYLRDILVYILSALLFTALILVLFISQHRIIRNMRMTQESLEAKNLELTHMNDILSEREMNLDKLTAEMKAIRSELKIK